MKVRRGEIVLVTLPFSQGGGSKLRPDLVVQNDTANARMTNTIVVAITRNVSRVSQKTQLLIDPETLEGKASGLIAPSAITCENLFTVGQNLIQRAIGKVSKDVMLQVNDCLKVALEID
jgi:mRNA interferase MazF